MEPKNKFLIGLMIEGEQALHGISKNTKFVEFGQKKVSKGPKSIYHRLSRQTLLKRLTHFFDYLQDLHGLTSGSKFFLHACWLSFKVQQSLLNPSLFSSMEINWIFFTHDSTSPLES